MIQTFVTRSRIRIRALELEIGLGQLVVRVEALRVEVP